MTVLWRKRVIPWPIKIAVAAASALATAYLAATAKKILPDNKSLEIAAICVLAAVSVGTSVRSVYLGRRVLVMERRAETLREQLLLLAFTVADISGTDVRQINTVFLVRRCDRRLRAYLDPTIRGELGAHEPSSVHWTIGKGVVGKAWSLEQVQFLDIRDLTARYAGCTEEQWTQLPEATNMNLTFRDWEVAQRKYGTVAAACVRGPKGIVGVIALNGPKDLDMSAHEDDIKTALVLSAKTAAQSLM